MLLDKLGTKLNNNYIQVKKEHHQKLLAKLEASLQTTQAQKQEVSYAHAQLQKTSYAQAQKQETSIQTELQRKCLRLNTWYTISGAHNTNQIRLLRL